MIRVFLPEGSNESRLIDQVDTMLGKISQMGFIRQLKGQKGMFEIRRIVKAFVDAQWLGEFEQQLAAYQQELAAQNGEADG